LTVGLAVGFTISLAITSTLLIHSEQPPFPARKLAFLGRVGERTYQYLYYSTRSTMECTLLNSIRSIYSSGGLDSALNQLLNSLLNQHLGSENSGETR
jgi:hypothetical protein